MLEPPVIIFGYYSPLTTQIARVLRVMGSVTAENWPDASSLPDFKKIFFPNFAPKPFSTVFPNASPCFITLLEQMLVLDPKRRITAETALRHAVSLLIESGNSTTDPHFIDRQPKLLCCAFTYCTVLPPLLYYISQCFSQAPLPCPPDVQRISRYGFCGLLPNRNPNVRGPNH